MKRYWALIAIFLIAITTAGSIVAWSKYSPGQPIEISLPPSPELGGQVYVGGAVNSPGFYPIRAGDSLDDIIRTAGGATGTADLSQIKLHVPESGEADLPQKIDINRAEARLLGALPGIGEVKAKAIIDYRQQNGPFTNITELTRVNGISITIFEQIKDLITVAD